MAEETVENQPNNYHAYETSAWDIMNHKGET